jgi:antitoxin component of MazEF toxin-antitoxin module
MESRVQRWGNSLAVRIPKPLAAEIGLEDSSPVELSLQDGKLVVAPAVKPAVVLSPAAYNAKVGLAIVCPVTSQIKGYPFEVPIRCRISTG